MLAAAMLLVGLVASASAVPLVGKDGKIHACYRVKGKPKGSLRVVPSAKKRCKRGERKVAWTVAGSSSQSQSASGQSGSNGANGTSGSTGTQGANGANGSTATLSTQVASLNLKLEGVEELLKGVNKGDLSSVVGKLNDVNGGELTGVLNTVKGVSSGELTGALDTVKGLTNGDLTEAVDAVPLVESLCTQTGLLTGNLDSLGAAVEGLGLNSVLQTLGGVLQIPNLPDALGTFDCTE